MLFFVVKILARKILFPVITRYVYSLDIYPLDLSARFYTAASATLVALPLHNGDGAEQLPVQDKRADRCM